jgi:hypothetical protein
MQEQEPTPTTAPVEQILPIEATEQEQSALITAESIPGYVAPEVPAVTEPTPVYSAESAAAIAQHRIIANQAQLIANTPPAPGTPVQTVERPPEA